MTTQEAIDRLSELFFLLGTGQRPDRVIWLDIHSLAATMCKQLNEAEAPKPTDA